MRDRNGAAGVGFLPGGICLLPAAIVGPAAGAPVILISGSALLAGGAACYLWRKRRGRPARVVEGDMDAILSVVVLSLSLMVGGAALIRAWHITLQERVAVGCDFPAAGGALRSMERQGKEPHDCGYRECW
jgi:hypothetical protein